MVKQIRIYIEGDPQLREGFRAFLQLLYDTAKSNRIKIEPPNGDPFRGLFASVLGSAIPLNPPFELDNRGKRSLVLNLDNAERVLIPAGSVLRGIVSAVDKAGRLDRTGRLTLTFDQITIRGRSYPIRATVTQALESEGIRGEAGRIGAGAGIGAILGGILGGFKGVLTGILVGGGGVIAATEGKDVTLPAGTILRVRLDTPLNLP